MKKIWIAVLIAAVATTGRAEPTAREIVETHTERHTMVHETTVMQIVLTDRKGNQEKRTLRRMDFHPSDGPKKSLTVFDAPADIRGTALLTRENKTGPNDQWIYFPSQHRLQRIAQSRRNSYFMGTDFTYEDLDPENIDHYLYQLLAPETIDDHECYVIEAVPASPEVAKRGGYSKRILRIRKDIFFIVKIEFYDRKDRLVKTQINSGLEKIEGETWRARHSIMENHAEKHQTEITVIERDTKTELGDDVFTERNILTGRYISR